jgi:hypothetical protein
MSWKKRSCVTGWHWLAIRVVVFFPDHPDRHDPLDQSLSWGTK